MALAYHCDKPGCDSWQRFADESLPPGWLIVTWDFSEYQFCSRDCLMVWSSQGEPMEVIPWGPDEP